MRNLRLLRGSLRERWWRLHVLGRLRGGRRSSLRHRWRRLNVLRSSRSSRSRSSLLCRRRRLNVLRLYALRLRGGSRARRLGGLVLRLRRCSVGLRRTRRLARLRRLRTIGLRRGGLGGRRRHSVVGFARTIGLTRLGRLGSVGLRCRRALALDHRRRRATTRLERRQYGLGADVGGALRGGGLGRSRGRDLRAWRVTYLGAIRRRGSGDFLHAVEARVRRRDVALRLGVGLQLGTRGGIQLWIARLCVTRADCCDRV